MKLQFMFRNHVLEIKSSQWQKYFLDWYKSMQKCIDHRGEYEEKYKSLLKLAVCRYINAIPCNTVTVYVIVYLFMLKIFFYFFNIFQYLLFSTSKELPTFTKLFITFGLFHPLTIGFFLANFNIFGFQVVCTIRFFKNF